MLKRISLILTAAVFALTAINLSAQTNAQELRLGSSVQVYINYGDHFWYTVRSATNSLLTIETTGSTDTYLEFYDSNLNLITENDDGGEDLNARIETFLAANRTYYIKLRGYGDHSEGSTRLWASTEPVPAATELRLNTPLQANIQSDASHWFSVRAASDGILTVETTGSTNTYLEAFNSSYILITEDDDGGEGTNARVEIFAEAGQTYIIKLRGYSSWVTGPTRIFASLEPFSADANNNTRARAAALRLGEPNHVIFRTENESRFFRYEMARAGTLTIYTSGNNIDTLLYLYDNSGELIASDDDSGDWLNAYISQRIHPGTYIIEVRTYSGTRGITTLHGEIR